MKKLLSLLFVLMMMLPAAFAEEESAPLMEVHQMAVGYADAYYIRVGDIELVIDGGNPNPRWPKDDVVNYLRDVGATTLDACIMTHWHLDHCMNMNEVLEAFGDDSTVTYGPSEQPVDTLTYEDRFGKIEIEIGPVVKGTYAQMKVDDVIQIGPLTITCVGPGTLKQDGRVNGDSLNFVLQYGERRILFTGDCTRTDDILAHEEICSQVDVLKFPHHGSEPYELKPNAMRVVAPTYVLIPSTFNNYKVFTYFMDHEVPVIRENLLTQREGHIVIVTDGGDLLEARTQQNPADYAPKAE